MNKYKEFLETKRHSIGNYGFEANYIPDIAFDFQKFTIEKAIRKGRNANFLDTGLGKTLIQISLAENIIRHTNKKVLILTPFMGVGSEVFSPVSMGRKAIGIELKDSYFKQAKLNLKEAEKRFKKTIKQEKLFL